MIDNWTHHTDAALSWIKRSFAATGGKGSSHSYAPMLGWAKAYPETSGYLIPTLLHYAALKQDHTLHELAVQCGSWLCTIQLRNGAFPEGRVGKSNPSTFNTAMILFGLSNLDKKILTEENKTPINNALSLATRWLLETQSKDGSWQGGAWKPGHVPSYYTRAVWAMLQAGQTLQWAPVKEKMRIALHFYANRIQTDGTVMHWGFNPGKKAFTHTIAYTLEGFLESAEILKEQHIAEKVMLSARALLAEFRRTGRLAGRYSVHWQGDYSFRCPTGEAQLSVLYFRLWTITGAPEFRQAAADILQEVLQFQNFGKNQNTYGALPGSVPFWGPYMRFRYPNWGVKFLLDALALQGQY